MLTLNSLIQVLGKCASYNVDCRQLSLTDHSRLEVDHGPFKGETAVFF